MAQQFNTRITHKHDTEANWNTASRATKPFIPLLGEIIFYDADSNYNYVRMKIGNGIDTAEALPFFSSQVQIITWEDDD